VNQSNEDRIDLPLPIFNCSAVPAKVAEPSEAERNLNEFKALSLERQRAILHIETSDEVFGPMSLFECAVEVPRAAKEIRQRLKEGLNVGASSTHRYEYCTFRYFRTDTPAHCKVTQATIRRLPDPAAIRDALGDSCNACQSSRS
jgi:hypothetical protein